MRRLSSTALTLSLVSFTTATALAQSPTSVPVPDPGARTAPSQPISPVLGVRPASLPQGAPPAGPSCGPGAVHGVASSDVQTGVWLVCEQVRAHTDRPAILGPNDPSPLYRVGLLRLGKSIVLTLHVESPAGTVRDGRQLRLSNIEELSTASPRLVDALWRGVPVAATERVGNLVGQETREYKKKHGEFLYGGGLTGSYVIGAGAGIQSGIDLRVGYESPRFGIGLGFRFANNGSHDDEKSAEYTGLAVGGRYFLSEGNIGPFVGGGLVWSGIGTREPALDQTRRYEGSGLGAYGELGVEMLRLHTSRLALDLRFEAPFYEVQSDPYPIYDSEKGTYETPERDNKYVAPMMVGLSYTF